MHALIEGKHGVNYLFDHLEGTSSADKHLLHLGFVKGAEIRIVSTNKKGDYILLVKDTRIAVDKTVVEKLMVSEKGEETTADFQTLDALCVGSTCQIERILGKGSVRRRLMDMGLTKGVHVTVRKVAPLGDPIEITIRGYELTLRKSEAERILVKE